MATNRSSFEKRERDRAKKAKAAAKREKRVARPGEEDEVTAEVDAAPNAPVDEGTVLAQVAALHQKFDDGDIEFEEFEERRNELMAQLMVD